MRSVNTFLKMGSQWRNVYQFRRAKEMKKVSEPITLRGIKNTRYSRIRGKIQGNRD